MPTATAGKQSLPLYSAGMVSNSRGAVKGRGVILGKFSSLKKWLAVPEAARKLSFVFKEEVTEADVLRLALDGHLKLSVRLASGAYVKRCNTISHSEKLEMQKVIDSFKAKIEQQLNDGKVLINAEVQAKLKDELGGLSNLLLLKEDRVLAVIGEIVQLAPDTYDLPMDGNERYCVEKICQALTGGAPPTLATHNGVLVTSHDGCQYFQLHGIHGMHAVDRKIPSPPSMKDAIFYPIGTLPEDADLVVRTDVLLEFEQSINGAPATTDATLHPKEWDNLLKMVIGMAIDGYGYDPTAVKSGIPKEIAKAVTDCGMSISDDTVRKYLRRAVNEVLPAMPPNA